MPHPLEATIREAYAAFGRGDVDEYLKACTDDFIFYVPGQGGIGGTYVGKEGLYDLARKAMTISGGTFREDVDDVLVNDRHAVVLARHWFTRAGLQQEYETAHVYEIRGGKLARCYEQPRNPAEFSNAWGADAQYVARPPLAS